MLTSLQTGLSDEANAVLVIVFVIVVGALFFYAYRKQAEFDRLRRASYTIPDPEELVIRAKYSVPYSNIEDVFKTVLRQLNYDFRERVWTGAIQGNSIWLTRELAQTKTHWWSRNADTLNTNTYFKKLANTRAGITREVYLIATSVAKDSLDIEVSAKPVMYFLIAQRGNVEHLTQFVSDSKIESIETIKLIMQGILQGTELEPPSVKPAIRVSAIRYRLAEAGLTTCSELLSSAETKIIQGNPEDAVKNCRSVLEQTIEHIAGRTVGTTNKFTNNLTKLRSNGRMDEFTEKFILDFYSYTSLDVHDKFKAQNEEARLVLRITENLVDYALKL